MLIRISPVITVLSVCAALAAFVAGPATAPADAASRYRVGIGDQHASMFANPAFQQLKLKRVRYLVPWDWQRLAFQREEIAAYIGAATASGKEVFVTFTASRGCWVDGRYSRQKHCRAPSASKYRRSFVAFRRAYPSVKVFSPWNEANHKSQPTARSPRLAAQYYNTMRAACRTCKIVAADVLDQGNAVKYLRGFLRYAKGKPRIWGLHNYSDVNRKRSRGTVRVLQTVPGEVWLTETGGVVTFLPSFPYSPRRAADRTRYMFRLADTYSKKRRGLRSRVSRIYPYSWTGVGRDERFDAGLTNPDGSVRPAYRVFRSFAKKRSK